MSTKDREECEPEVWEVDAFEIVPDPTQWANIARARAVSDSGDVKIMTSVHDHFYEREMKSGQFELQFMVEFAHRLDTESRNGAVVFWTDGNKVAL